MSTRMRIPTEKGESYRQEIELKYQDQLAKIKTKCDQLIFDIARDVYVEPYTKEVQYELKDLKQKYLRQNEDYMSYLTRQNTEISKSECQRLKTNAEALILDIHESLGYLNKEALTVKNDPEEDNRSELSNCSSTLLKTSAKAEAAKTRLKFIEEEAELVKQQSLLRAKREYEEAQAELNAMNDIMNDGESVSSNARRNRTLKFVKDQNKLQYPISELRQEAEEFIPRAAQVVQATIGQTSAISELSKFIIKKDLLLSRLSKFQDNSESYLLWKVSFNSIMTELDATAFEQLDLLVKWLGPESTKFATSIRSANIENPTLGLKRLWSRLNEYYGNPVMIEAALKERLNNVKKITVKDYKKLYDLSDVLSEIEAIKERAEYSDLLAYYDSSSGVTPIVNKLPHNIQEKWVTAAVRYKRQNDVIYPPFSFFVTFIKDQAAIKNDPSLTFESSYTPTHSNANQNSKLFTTKKTTVNNDCQTLPRTHTSATPVPMTHPQAHKSSVSLSPVDGVTQSKPATASISQNGPICPFHGTTHTLNKCRVFRTKSLQERRDFIINNGLCLKCCGQGKHSMKDCLSIKISCGVCGSLSHPTALHDNNSGNSASPPLTYYGGERKTPYINNNSAVRDNTPVTSNCMQICGTETKPKGKSCAKTLLVYVYPEGHPEKKLKMYAIIDDQSNRTLARSELFDHFKETGNELEYILSSCSGEMVTSGRRATGYIVESFDGSTKLNLPTLVECEQIPNIRDEIPTPDIPLYYPHMEDISSKIQPIDQDAQILLLIGRDLSTAHHVLGDRKPKLGQPNVTSRTPFALQLPLGWVIIGQTCLGKTHQPEDDVITVNKINILPDGRPSILEPCPNSVFIKDHITHKSSHTDAIFEKTDKDECIGQSVEDKEFLKLMFKEMKQDEDGTWVAPLPFRKDKPILQSNRSQAVNRALILDKSLKSNPEKKDLMVTFMEKILTKGHAEVAPSLAPNEEHWYLPLFGVYNKKKPGQIRGVFDASAKCRNVSLNDCLLTGPDLTNNLLGILLRFRDGPTAITADIESMFYCFKVSENHRNFLRFMWYEENNPAKKLIDYRMTVHVFGNSPSPAVATFGLRKAVSMAESDIQNFVNDNFYVDDALLATKSEQEAVSLVSRTQTTLNENGNIRLHKIASNSKEVLDKFDDNDLAKGLKDLNFCLDSAPLQKSLGLCWDITNDTFTFRVSNTEKPLTRRGILSTVNSIYDPIGFVAPTVIQGKLVLRTIMSSCNPVLWDEPLPEELLSPFEDWRKSLENLQTIEIPRPYTMLTTETDRQVHIFCDASNEAIAVAAYLKIYDINDNISVSFILGKAKVAPTHGHTIPRLELCSAVLAVEVANILSSQLNLDIRKFQFYTDSKIVLGYIYNRKRRFYVYVENRVDKIHKATQPSQWSHVQTKLNPADQATRSSCNMKENMWLTGPQFLYENKFDHNDDYENQDYSLVDESKDKEVRPEIITCKTSYSTQTGLGTERFKKFSNWKRLVCAIDRLKRELRKVKTAKSERKTCMGIIAQNMESINSTEKFIIQQVQQEHYHKEISCIRNGKSLSKDSPIISLSPYLDDENLLRVGGRLKQAEICFKEKHPIIIPGKNHVAKLLVTKYHEDAKHQGRHLTEGTIRSNGLWITGAKRLIASLIHSCVTCRKLRGKSQIQQMADLPSDRLTPTAPFSSVGVDVFGPWSIVTRKTRGGTVNSKRWGVLLTCLTTRAVHIELVEEMTSSSFINALRRFISIRGKVLEFRSDRGTNFVGATDDLQIDAINVEDGPTSNYLHHNGIVWIFNPPHSSHMGGVWERMIRTTRQILDYMLLDVSAKNLTHEVLSTFMAEVCAVINSRPITAVSHDPEFPMILSPSLLLTYKSDCITAPAVNFTIKDMYKSQWKRVQYLSDQFWARWQKEYLQSLQKRQKWTQPTQNIKNGDIILCIDKNLHRSQWSIGVVTNAIPSSDGKVRKAEIRVSKNGSHVTYTRPITEMVLLLGE